MASTSSLLKSAAATRQKVRDYQDALVAYEWQNSTKTYGDYVAYERYLTDQQQSVADPMDQLNYQKKIDTARSGYISNEIQRQSINVIEGQGSSIDKYNRMTDLYYHAEGAGQFDLAQSLRLQMDNLSVTIQNEQRAALASNKERSTAYAKDIQNMVADAASQVKDNSKYILDIYKNLGPDQFQAEYGSDIFSVLANMVNSQDPNNPGLVQIYDQAAQLTTDPADARKFQIDLNNLANGGPTGIDLPGVGGISYQDLADQAYAASIGQTLFMPNFTGDGVAFTKQKTTGYTWGRDENGEYKLMPIKNSSQDFIFDKDKNLSYRTLLEKKGANAGLEVIKGGSGNDDTLIVRNNGAFDSVGVPRGTQVQLYVDINGKLQFVKGDKAYSLNFDPNSADFTGLTPELPNTINLLPTGSGRTGSFNNRYFAGKDLSNMPAGTIGLVDTTSPLARSMEAGPLAKPQFNPQQGAPLQQPSPIQFQPGANPSMQSTVNPENLPNMNLSVAKPQPLPRITIAKPQPLPRISVTQPPQQQANINVGVAPSYGGTLRVGF